MAPALALQEELDLKWQRLPRTLQECLRAWQYNLVVCALQELQHTGVFLSYSIVDSPSNILVCCQPFRGFTKWLEVDTVRECIRELPTPGRNSRLHDILE